VEFSIPASSVEVAVVGTVDWSRWNVAL